MTTMQIKAIRHPSIKYFRFAMKNCIPSIQDPCLIPQITNTKSLTEKVTEKIKPKNHNRKRGRKNINELYKNVKPGTAGTRDVDGYGHRGNTGSPGTDKGMTR
ncbi:hypothetical protein CDAR_236351 [Caerostris darwini]|uniref:Uncharacterized protein n=1 Tax=Caerostris darwini TaxID=1538125 RepID=A0AAV4T7K9_9ARAC|nr:hypothetical protein CDAR_236351 [Caerostris darwini]